MIKKVCASFKMQQRYGGSTRSHIGRNITVSKRLKGKQKNLQATNCGQWQVNDVGFKKLIVEWAEVPRFQIFV